MLLGLGKNGLWSFESSKGNPGKETKMTSVRPNIWVALRINSE